MNLHTNPYQVSRVGELRTWKTPDGKLEFDIPETQVLDRSWTILGHVEFETADLIGDPLFNVLAHKVSDKGINHWAIGWEIPGHPNTGFGFEDGFYYRAKNYIPVSFVMGVLTGRDTGRWRFRGQKTWVSMTTNAEVVSLWREQQLRLISRQLLHFDFDIVALGWYDSVTHSLTVDKNIAAVYLERLKKAAYMFQPKVAPAYLRVFKGREHDSFVSSDIILFVPNLSPAQVLMVDKLLKPRHMSWGDFVTFIRNTGVWPINKEITHHQPPMKVIDLSE